MSRGNKPVDQVRESVTTIGAGYPPPTVSAPGIHYITTATIEARTIIGNDTCIFLAYSSSFAERILHPLESKHAFSFYKERPLYLEDAAIAQGSASIFNLLCDKFRHDDPPHLHIFFHQGPELDFTKPIPPAEQVRIRDRFDAFKDNFETLVRGLPFTPRSADWWHFPDPPTDLEPGKPRMLTLNGQPTDRLKYKPVEMDDGYLQLGSPPERFEDLMDLE